MKISRTAYRLEVMLPRLVNETFNNKFKSADLYNDILRGIGDVTLSPRHLPKMAKASLDNQDFIASVATNVEQKILKAEDVESEKNLLDQTLLEALYKVGTRSASPSVRPVTNISDQQTNKKPYSKTSEKPYAELLLWSEVMIAGIKYRKIR